MIYLRTGKPGASKTLNSLVELCKSWDTERPFYYNNVPLLMLDYDVASSFSGWFYGWYFPRLTNKNKKAKTRLLKIMRRVHDDDEFIKLDDVPFLAQFYEQHDHLETWLFWVRRCYSKSQLTQFNEMVINLRGSDSYNFDSLKSFNLHFTKFEDPCKWYELPKRSVIFIDECQQFFPPRGVNAKNPTVPKHISEFETHRHKGYDVHLVTQDPKLMDVNIRRLTGRHVHYHNPFGGERVTRYQESKQFDPDDYFATKNCTKSLVKRNKKFYGVYWSADIHTHKFQVPKFVLVFFALIILLCFLGYHFYFNFLGKHEDPKQEQVKPPVPEHAIDDTIPTKPKTTKTVSNLDSALGQLLKDVYITGSVVKYSEQRATYYYSFANVESDTVFYPENLGGKIEPVTRCSALLKISDKTYTLTCNPFYKRVPVEDIDEKITESDTLLASN